MNKNLTDLTLLKQTALKAGEIARQYFIKGNTKVWDKSHNHPVTEADISVNEYLQKTLIPARPDYGWLSEETRDDASRLGKRRSFVIDPIDGTRAFIAGKPHFTICLAVIEEGKSVCGVIYNPITSEHYSAARNHGAYLNDKTIKPSMCNSIENCAIIGYPQKFKRQNWPKMRVSIRNSMAYRIAMVASGQRDATVAFTPKSDWDLAAADIIAKQAGAKITDLNGKEFNFAKQSVRENGVICASPPLHNLLLQEIQKTATQAKI